MALSITGPSGRIVAARTTRSRGNILFVPARMLMTAAMPMAHGLPCTNFPYADWYKRG
jgi:hypothetical protein